MKKASNPLSTVNYFHHCCITTHNCSTSVWTFSRLTLKFRRLKQGKTLDAFSIIAHSRVVPPAQHLQQGGSLKPNYDLIFFTTFNPQLILFENSFLSFVLIDKQENGYILYYLRGPWNFFNQQLGKRYPATSIGIFFLIIHSFKRNIGSLLGYPPLKLLKIYSPAES